MRSKYKRKHMEIKEESEEIKHIEITERKTNQILPKLKKGAKSMSNMNNIITESHKKILNKRIYQTLMSKEPEKENVISREYQRKEKEKEKIKEKDNNQKEKQLNTQQPHTFSRNKEKNDIKNNELRSKKSNENSDNKTNDNYSQKEQQTIKTSHLRSNTIEEKDSIFKSINSIISPKDIIKKIIYKKYSGNNGRNTENKGKIVFIKNQPKPEKENDNKNNNNNDDNNNKKKYAKKIQLMPKSNSITNMRESEKVKIINSNQIEKNISRKHYNINIENSNLLSKKNRENNNNINILNMNNYVTTNGININNSNNNNNLSIISEKISFINGNDEYSAQKENDNINFKDKRENNYSSKKMEKHSERQTSTKLDRKYLKTIEDENEHNSNFNDINDDYGRNQKKMMITEPQLAINNLESIDIHKEKNNYVQNTDFTNSTYFKRNLNGDLKNYYYEIKTKNIKLNINQKNKEKPSEDNTNNKNYCLSVEKKQYINNELKSSIMAKRNENEKLSLSKIRKFLQNSNRNQKEKEKENEYTNNTYYNNNDYYNNNNSSTINTIICKDISLPRYNYNALYQLPYSDSRTKLNYSHSTIGDRMIINKDYYSNLISNPISPTQSQRVYYEENSPKKNNNNYNQNKKNIVLEHLDDSTQDLKRWNNIGFLSPIFRKNTSLPIKTFKFLVHEAYIDNKLRDSFRIFYDKRKKEKNSNNNNYNSLSTSYENENSVLSNNLFSDSKNLQLSRQTEYSHFRSNTVNKDKEQININGLRNCFRHKIMNLSKKKKGLMGSKDKINIQTSINKDNFYQDTEMNNDTNNLSNNFIYNNKYNTTNNFFKLDKNNNNRNNNNYPNENDNLDKNNSLVPERINDQNIDDENKNVRIDIKKNINDSKYLITSPISSSLSSTKESNNIFEIELLYNLEKKILLMIQKINDYQMCKDECTNYINYYFDHKVYEYIIKLFRNNHNKNNIINYLKIEILCYFLCYDITYNKYFNQAALLIKSIIKIVHNNFLLFIVLKLSDYAKDNQENVNNNSSIVTDLNTIIKDNLTIRIDEKDINELYIIQIINNNTKEINNYYKMILDNLYKDCHIFEGSNNNNKMFKFPECINNIDINSMNEYENNRIDIITMFFNDSYQLLNSYNINDLKYFFDIFLNRAPLPSLSSSRLTSNVFSQGKTSEPYFSSTQTNFNLKKFVKKKPIIKASFPKKKKAGCLPEITHFYKYSLVLELHETLVYFDREKKQLTIRPGLIEFLDDMVQLYELILYSYDCQIVENIVNIIEKENRYFEYILDGNYGINNKNDNNNTNYFIRDLNLLNRSQKNIIFIDGNHQNLELFTNNSIFIKPFYGNIQNEQKTLTLLSQLLQNIRLDADISQDIRISLNKYKKSYAYRTICQ